MTSKSSYDDRWRGVPGGYGDAVTCQKSAGPSKNPTGLKDRGLG